MKSISSLLGWIVLAGVSSAACGAETPNIVVIVADDLGWADIGYHASDTMTPNLDRLAAGGMKLEQYYVCPTCSPTRLGILAGRNPSRYDVLGPIGGKSTQHLPVETTTLADALRSCGYSTHISGKWHLGLQLQYAPRKYGFDTSYGYLHGQIDPYTHLYKFGDRTWHRNDQFIDEQGHATDLITAEAVRVINESRGKPFFLYVAYSVPHYPLKEPEKWTFLYNGKIDDPWRKLNAASITHMDDGIGRIVAALDRTAQRENTLIVFTSDNGGQQSWSAPKTEYNGSYQPHTTLGNNQPLRGWKGQLYEGGIRVPALVHWPGRIEAGGQCDQVLCELDWLPTLAAVGGYTTDASLRLDGQDVWSQLLSEPLDGPRELYWRTRGQLALRQGPWKLITDASGEKAELFNIAEDPLEQDERSAQQPRRVAELKELLARQRKRDH